MDEDTGFYLLPDHDEDLDFALALQLQGAFGSINASLQYSVPFVCSQ